MDVSGYPLGIGRVSPANEPATGYGGDERRPTHNGTTDIVELVGPLQPVGIQVRRPKENGATGQRDSSPETPDNRSHSLGATDEVSASQKVFITPPSD